MSASMPVPASAPPLWPRAGVPGVWLGAMTPKRSARRAVTRNAIRRQVYALGPQVNLPAEGMAYLVRLRAPYAREQFPSACSNALRHAVRTELTQLFERGRDKPCAPH